MTKKDLEKAVESLKSETKESLQTLFDSVNKGQKKKIAKIPEVRELFDRYGVDYEEYK
jgi:hypothetical protein